MKPKERRRVLLQHLCASPFAPSLSSDVSKLPGLHSTEKARKLLKRMQTEGLATDFSFRGNIHWCITDKGREAVRNAP